MKAKQLIAEKVATKKSQSFEGIFYGKRWIIFLFGMILSLSIRAQGNATHYFSDSSFNMQSAKGFQKLDFKWSISPAAQLEMNQGINSIDEENFSLGIKHFTSVLDIDRNFAPAFYYRGVCNKILNLLGPAAYDMTKAVS